MAKLKHTTKTWLLILLITILIGAAFVVWSLIFKEAEIEIEDVVQNNEEQVDQEEVVVGDDEGMMTDESTEEDEKKVKKNVIISSLEKDPVVTKVEITPKEYSEDPHVKKAAGLIGEFLFSEAYDELKAANQEDPIVVYYMGLLSAYWGNRTEAEELLGRVVDMTSDERIISNAQEIIKTYQLFDTYQDGKSEFLDTLISKNFLEAGEIEIAIDKLKFVTENYVDYTDAWILLGSAYMVYGNYEKGIDTLTQVLPSQKPEVYYWLGLAYLYEEIHNKALAAMKQALNKNYQPLYKVHEKMGDIFLSLEDYAASAEAYEKALYLPEATKYIDLYVRPVWIYIDLLEEPQKALELSQKALENNPNSAMAHNLLGWSYLAMGQENSAKELLLKAKEMDPSVAAIHLNLGNYYREVEEYKLAKESYLQAVQLDPDGAVGKRARSEYAVALRLEREENED